MSLSILALVVVYGTVPSQSPAITSLGAIEKRGVSLRTLVWDNSPNPLKCELTDGNWGKTSWVHTPENRGLSAIYNEVIARWLQPSEYLLLLDQDTLLPANFFESAVAAMTRNPTVELFLPMVRAHERWVSPLDAAVGWGRYWKTPRIGLLPSRHVGAINSGMIIAASYLQSTFVGYDRDLQFYGTDTFFMLEFRRQNRWVWILDAVIDHDLSFFSTSTTEKVTKFRAMRRANMICYRRSAWPVRWTVRTVMTGVAFVYSLRYRDLGFLRPH